MKKHEILSPQARAFLFDPPIDQTSIVRHYTLSADDLALIRRRRRDENRIGFAVHMAYMRFSGRVLGPGEIPKADVLSFMGDQLSISADAFAEYASREETRWEHVSELQSHLGVRPFNRRDHKSVTAVAEDEAAGTDRGDAIVSAMTDHLRRQGILLPAAAELERIALGARARVRQLAHEALIADLGEERSHALGSLTIAEQDERRTPLAWLRDWPEAPSQNHLSGIVERLQAVRRLGIGSDREHRIHRARYTAIARETSVLSAQHIARLDDRRRLATLVVFAREMEAILTDAGIAMFDKILGTIFRKADTKHKQREVERAKSLNASTRDLLRMARAMRAAKKSGDNLDAAVERSIGWARLDTLIDDTDDILTDYREDNLAEVMSHHRTVHRVAQLVLAAFTFRSWKEDDPLLEALDTLRRSFAAKRGELSPLAATGFLAPQWRKLIGTGKTFNQRAYETAVMVHLRDRLRAGDIWVEGSRAFRAFDDFLLAPEVFAARQSEHRLGLAVPGRFDEWRRDWISTLESRLAIVDRQAAAGELPEAVITEAGGLSLSPIRSAENDAVDGIARKLYGMLPRLRITELLAEVNSWTGFANRFVHLQSGTPPADEVTLMSTILADATNLGLTRMARSSGAGNLTRHRLIWTAEWHIRDETYAAGLACLVEAIHAQPFTTLWGDGETSSSDGQFFRAGGRGEARADHNARYGSEPGVKFYTHVSDRFAPFHTKVIAANASEAMYVLDGLLHHETSVAIREHYTDTAGAAEHVFGLCHLLGFRFAPRIRDLADRKLYVSDGRQRYATLGPMIGGTINLRTIEENWDEILRLAASVRAGTVAPSALLRKLAAYPRQNALAKALKEIGRLDRTLFTLDWITDPALRRRAQVGLNKGESRNALARTLFFHRHGEIRDRTFENQCYRASGLNLTVAAVVLWNTVYLSRAVAEIHQRGEVVPDELLTHIAPLGWEHISFNGDYIWPNKPLQGQYRPLRAAQQRLSLLEAA